MIKAKPSWRMQEMYSRYKSQEKGKNKQNESRETNKNIFDEILQTGMTIVEPNNARLKELGTGY